MTVNPVAPIRISVTGDVVDGRARMRVTSPALADSVALRAAVGQRYGRVMEGLARQLRSPLRHDATAGGYEIAIAVTGLD